MTVTLTGFMGCGKSSVGRKLASLLGYEFMDLDQYVEHKAGMSIPEIFGSGGEQRFRALEAEALRDLVVMNEVAGRDMVIALGGGTITITSVQDLILRRTRCVYLRTSLETICRRLGPDTSSRPIFSKELYPARLATYEKAPLAVDTDGKKPAQIAAEIKEIL